MGISWDNEDRDPLNNLKITNRGYLLIGCLSTFTMLVMFAIIGGIEQ